MAPTASVQSYDLVIIGTGSGNSIIGPAFDEWSIAIVEEWVFGGTCLNRGCIPTKMLVHTADVAQTIVHSSRYDVDATLDEVRWKSVRDRVFGRIDPIAIGGRALPRGGLPERHRPPRPRAVRRAAADRGHRRRRIDDGDRGPPGRRRRGRPPADPATSPGSPRSTCTRATTSCGSTRCPSTSSCSAAGSSPASWRTCSDRSGPRCRSSSAGCACCSTRTTTCPPRSPRTSPQRFDLRTGVEPRFVTQDDDGSVTVHLSDDTSITGSHLLVGRGRTPNSDLARRRRRWARRPPRRADRRRRVPAHDAGRACGRSATSARRTCSSTSPTTRPESSRTTSPTPIGCAPPTTRAVPHAVFTNPQIAAVGMTEMRGAVGGDRRDGRRCSATADVAYGWALEDTTSFCKLIADASTRRLVGAHIIGTERVEPHPAADPGHPLRPDDRRDGRDQYYIHPALGELVENALLNFPATAG